MAKEVQTVSVVLTNTSRSRVALMPPMARP